MPINTKDAAENKAQTEDSTSFNGQEAADNVVDFATGKPGAPPPPKPPEFWNPWDRPVPPAFPLDVLPDQLRAVVQDTHETIGTDLGATAMAHLTGIAGAIDGRTCVYVQRHTDWTESARLWLAILGDPSTKKSPLIRRVLRAFRHMETKQQVGYVEALKAWEAAPKKSRGPEPKQPTYLIADATTETAGRILSYTERGLVLDGDELSGWIGSMERYKNSKTDSDRPFWLRAYEGGQFRVDRIVRGCTWIPNLSVNIVGGIQMDRLKALNAQAGLTDDGLLQRFLPVFAGPASLGVDRPGQEAWYMSHIEAIIGLPTRQLRLDEAGHVLKEQAFARYHALTGGGIISKGFCGWAGKLPGFLMRLAVAVYFADPACLDAKPNADGSYTIPTETVTAAVRLVDQFLLGNAVAFFTELAGGGDEETLAAASWILRQDGKTHFKLADFGKGPRCCRGKDEFTIRKIISPLIMGGWLIPAGQMAHLPACKDWILATGLREALLEETKQAKERFQQAMDLIHASAAQRRVEKAGGTNGTDGTD